MGNETKTLWRKFQFSKYHNWKIDAGDNWFIDCGLEEHSEEHADLIVSAVNGCKSVNKDNPQVVAESINDIVGALHVALDLASQKLYQHPDDAIAQLQFNLFKDLLNKIEAK